MSPCSLILFDEFDKPAKRNKYQSEITQFSYLHKIWSSLSHSNSAPYLTIISGLLTMITLAWIAVAQSNHIEQLGKKPTALFVNSIFNDPDQLDRLSEDDQHYD